MPVSVFHDMFTFPLIPPSPLFFLQAVQLCCPLQIRQCSKCSLCCTVPLSLAGFSQARCLLLDCLANMLQFVHDEFIVSLSAFLRGLQPEKPKEIPDKYCTPCQVKTLESTKSHCDFGRSFPCLWLV